jgi:hypothetical protein
MSTASFSPLEIQLVRASLSTRTTGEICELLERSVEDVTELINDITDGKAEDRDRDVILYLHEKQQEKQKKTGRPRAHNSEAIALQKKRKAENVSINRARSNKAAEAERAWETQRATYRKREDQRKYKTRVVDPATLITVKLDEKTWAQVPIQATKEKTELLIKQTKALYDANKTLNKYKISNI